MKRIAVWITIVSFLLTPTLSLAQSYQVLGDPESVKVVLPSISPHQLYAQGSADSSSSKDGCVEAKKAGEKEGDRETNKVGWFLMGFGIGLIGVAVAAASDPGHPSETALASSSNKTCYDEGYRGKKKSQRLSYAFGGVGFWVGFYIGYLLTHSSNSNK